MRKLIESTLVSLNGVIETPERWASFDAEATALSLDQLGPSSAIARLKDQPGKDLIKYGTRPVPKDQGEFQRQPSPQSQIDRHAHQLVLHQAGAPSG